MKMKSIIVSLVILFTAQLFPQSSRIKYNNRDIFLNGVNIAWISFSGDIGKGSPYMTGFNDIFKKVHDAGGNTLRFWMHTTGSSSPQFNGYTQMVTGPGTYTIPDMKKILDAAQANNVGLLLSLWSFDMLRISNGATLTDRAKKMLTDTAYTNAYINKCLIPMVQALKGHPAIVAWEVFNEPEGMSNEYGWDITYHVPMLNIRRFVNLVAGAIHRTDPNALVTNGCWSMTAQTDIGVTAMAKTSIEDKLILSSEDSRKKIEQEFLQKYGENLQAEDIVRQYGMRYSGLQSNTNEYRDDRLVSAGGDTLGILDFYTVHYYDWDDPNAHSPFHNPCSRWKLNKPLAVAEFFAIDTYGVKANDLYDSLYTKGYAGALAWDWNTSSQRPAQTSNMKYLYENFGPEVDPFPATGKIYAFKATPGLIEKGDSSLIRWSTSVGSTVTLDNVSVPENGSFYVKPLSTNSYRLTTSGQQNLTSTTAVTVYPTGKIFAFTATPNKVATGEKSVLKWNTSRGSSVKLNDIDVKDKDSLEVTATTTMRYSLKASGDVNDTTSVLLTVVDPQFVNRALNSTVKVTSSEQGKGHDNPLYAADGRLSTYWMSDYTDAQNIELDLQRLFQVNKIVINWDAAYALKYRIAVSSDRAAYQLVKNNLNGKGGTEVFDSLKSDARFVKILLDKRATQLGYAIKEIEVYGIQKDLASAEPEGSLRPQTYSLSQNYPNPFNPATQISYQLPKDGNVSLKVYNSIGQEVMTLVNGFKAAGRYTVTFNAGSLSSGIYLYRISAGEFQEAHKMTLLK